MRHSHQLVGWSGRAALVVLALTAGGTAAIAQPAPPVVPAPADTLGTPDAAAEAEGPNRGRLSMVVNNDFTTAYMFRGILQERNGFIWQPSIDLALNLYQGDGIVSSVDLGFGIWNSFQTEKTFADGSGPSNLYETDYYPSLTVGWSPGIETSLTYVVYTGPNGSFDTIQQLDLGIAYDDSELLGPFAMGPAATFSFELENSSFGSDQTGKYFELTGAPGLELSLPLDDDGRYPVTASFPLALGLSMDKYYADGTTNPTFGFFSFGLGASVPLAFIPEDFGSFSVGAAINVYVLSQQLKELVDDDNPFPVGVGSITWEY